MSTSDNASAAVKRPVGRPRADGQDPGGDVKEQILVAAARRFSKDGYTATSTRQIASDVGLRQGSLSHYFKRKEDMLTVRSEMARRGWS